MLLAGFECRTFCVEPSCVFQPLSLVTCAPALTLLTFLIVSSADVSSFSTFRDLGLEQKHLSVISG